MLLNPAILTNDKKEYEYLCFLLSKFVNALDIDVIDWSYTVGKTLTTKDLLDIDVLIPLNFDLMLDDPSEAVELLIHDSRVEKIILNIRSKKDILPLITKIRNNKKRVAVSFSDEKDYKKILKYFSLVDSINIYAVEPGAQGNPFRPDMLVYANKLKEDGFKGEIGLDGGVNKNTLPLILKYPFDIVVSGSAIVKGSDPKQSYYELLNIIKESKYTRND